MRIEAGIFNLPSIFFFIMAVIYGWLNDWHEWVGFTAILLTGALSLMVGIYFHMLAKRHGTRPEDRDDGEISELSGDQGVFPPWSWWPLVLAAGVALAFLAMAAGWWLMVPAGIVTVIGLVGWVMEFSLGRHAH